MPLIHLSSIEQKQIVPGYDARFIHTDNMTFSYVNIKAGEILPEHSHMNEQVLNMLQGTFMLTLEGEPLTLEPGMVVVIPSNAKHSGTAITDCYILDVFYPVREEYKNL